MKVLVTLFAAALLAGVGAQEATAHSVGWPIHKALCKVGLKCRDVPPRPGPQTDCTDANRGEIRRIWDERLGAYVEWECTENGWRRVRIVPAESVPWAPPERRTVYDWHRACKSIVCGRIRVTHYYPTRWLLGR